MLSDDMAENYRRFFAWARQGDPSDIGYPHSTPERKLLGAGIGCEGLSDDEATHIDRVLGLLKRHSHDAYRVCVWVHRDGKSLRQLQMHKRGDRRANARLLSDAHEFLRGYLSALAA